MYTLILHPNDFQKIWLRAAASVAIIAPKRLTSDNQLFLSIFN